MGDKNIREKINSSVYSYQDLSARLYSYCAKEFGRASDINIFFLHSEHDTGKGTAVLDLFRQFAVFPVDIVAAKDCHELIEISAINEFKGTTLVIDCLPIYPVTGDSAEANQDIKSFPRTLSAVQELYMSEDRSSVEQQVNKTLQTLSEKAAAFSELLSGVSDNFSANLIYLSGLTVLRDIDDIAGFPETSMIPWYMLSRKGGSTMRVYQQPELTSLFAKLEVSSPQIENLEQLLKDSA